MHQYSGWTHNILKWNVPVSTRGGGCTMDNLGLFWDSYISTLTNQTQKSNHITFQKQLPFIPKNCHIIYRNIISRKGTINPHRHHQYITHHHPEKLVSSAQSVWIDSSNPHKSMHMPYIVWNQNISAGPSISGSIHTPRSNRQITIRSKSPRQWIGS